MAAVLLCDLGDLFLPAHQIDLSARGESPFRCLGERDLDFDGAGLAGLEVENIPEGVGTEEATTFIEDFRSKNHRERLPPRLVFDFRSDQRAFWRGGGFPDTQAHPGGVLRVGFRQARLVKQVPAPNERGQ